MSGRTLIGAHVRLRPVQSNDRDVLMQIFNDPEVLRWWGDPEQLVADALAASESEAGFIVERGGESIGFIQYYEETDPMYRHAAVDIALRSGWIGRGFGVTRCERWLPIYSRFAFTTA